VLAGVALVATVLTATLLRGARVSATGVVEEPGEASDEPGAVVAELAGDGASAEEEERRAA